MRPKTTLNVKLISGRFNPAWNPPSCPGLPPACLALVLALLAGHPAIAADASSAPPAQEHRVNHHPSALSNAGRGLLRPVNVAGAAVPGLSQAVIVENGRLMFLSGHVPMTRGGGILPPSLEAQLVQVFENLHATLRDAGGGAESLVRITIYVRGFQSSMLPLIRGVRDRYVDVARPPASALIGVDALFHPDVLVEVDAVAVLPPKP